MSRVLVMIFCFTIYLDAIQRVVMKHTSTLYCWLDISLLNAILLKLYLYPNDDFRNYLPTISHHTSYITMSFHCSTQIFYIFGVIFAQIVVELRGRKYKNVPLMSAALEAGVLHIYIYILCILCIYIYIDLFIYLFIYTYAVRTWVLHECGARYFCIAINIKVKHGLFPMLSLPLCLS